MPLNKSRCFFLNTVYNVSNLGLQVRSERYFMPIALPRCWCILVSI